MKTRQEMIYDFMLALASNPAVFNVGETETDELMVFDCACELADEYLRRLG
jgi:hypothetical protein